MASVARQVIKSVLSKEQAEGVGARVRRSIGRRELTNVDPFLMLDEFTVTKPAGFPDHPHRGFETVTYMLEGAFQHEDFAGHKGTIYPGDLQWMTAGKGILHAEMPAGEGVNHGLQLWINLPKAEKMCEPAYQELRDKDIPRANPQPGVEVKVIAGESFGIKSPVYTRTPTMYLDFKVAKGQSVQQTVPKDFRVFAYMLSGNAYFGNTKGEAHHTLVFDNDGDHVSIETKDSDTRFVLIGGKPLNEPVIQYGPFVMNSEDEIFQTMSDYDKGRNGFERAKRWHSNIA